MGRFSSGGAAAGGGGGGGASLMDATENWTLGMCTTPTVPGSPGSFTMDTINNSTAPIGSWIAVGEIDDCAFQVTEAGLYIVIAQAVWSDAGTATNPLLTIQIAAGSTPALPWGPSTLFASSRFDDSPAVTLNSSTVWLSAGSIVQINTVGPADATVGIVALGLARAL